MVFEKIKYVFLIYAFSLNVLHAMIPHSHEESTINDESVLVSDNKTPEIIHILVGFLKFDLGEDHLDKYVKFNNNYSDSISYQLISVFQFKEQDTYLVSVQSQAVIYYSVTISSCTLQSVIVRGPPCMDLVLNC